MPLADQCAARDHRLREASGATSRPKRRTQCLEVLYLGVGYRTTTGPSHMTTLGRSAVRLFWQP